MMRTKPRAIVMVAALLVLRGLGSFSQAVQAASTTLAPAAVQALEAPQGTQSGTQSTNEYLPPPGQYEKAVAYSSAHYRHLAISSLWAMVVPLLIARWRLAPRYRDWASRLSSRRLVQVLLYAPPLVLTLALMSLPFDLWDHSLERSFGLSVQGWTSWFGDWMTEQVIAVILGTLLIWILYGVIRRSPRRWWFYFWLVSMPIALAVIFVQPLVIDPLFHKFEPLQRRDAPLTAALEKMVQRAGQNIPPERMFWMGAGEKTTGLNAYVA